MHFRCLSVAQRDCDQWHAYTVRWVSLSKLEHLWWWTAFSQNPTTDMFRGGYLAEYEKNVLCLSIHVLNLHALHALHTWQPSRVSSRLPDTYCQMPLAHLPLPAGDSFSVRRLLERNRRGGQTEILQHQGWDNFALCSIVFVFFPPTLHIRKFNSHVLVALGNYQVSDDGWMSLCLSSRGLRTLHIPDCPKLTNSSLRVMANLKGLQHLDISHCSKFVYSLILSF